MSKQSLIFSLTFVLMSTLQGACAPAGNVPLPATECVSPTVGCTAPSFELTSIHGQEVRLGDLRGHPVLINFWATWCGPCSAEMPYIESIYKSYKDKGLMVVGIDNKESSSDVQAFANKHVLTFSLLLDTNGEVTNLYRVNGFPTSFFIDERGAVKDIFVGSMNRNQVETFVTHLMGSSMPQRASEEPAPSKGIYPVEIPQTKFAIKFTIDKVEVAKDTVELFISIKRTSTDTLRWYNDRESLSSIYLYQDNGKRFMAIEVSGIFAEGGSLQPNDVYHGTITFNKPESEVVVFNYPDMMPTRIALP